MSNCKGITGWLFGHEFELFVTYNENHYPHTINANMMNPKEVRNLMYFKTVHAESILCKRCGVLPP